MCVCVRMCARVCMCARHTASLHMIMARVALENSCLLVRLWMTDIFLHISCAIEGKGLVKLKLYLTGTAKHFNCTPAVRSALVHPDCSTSRQYDPISTLHSALVERLFVIQISIRTHLKRVKRYDLRLPILRLSNT